MNIFVLDKDPRIAAQYHNDRHVVKMILETAQILSTINHKYGVEAPYKATHHNHPCVLWAEQSTANYEWLVTLGFALCNEYTHRYNKIHKSVEALVATAFPPEDLPVGELTPFAQAMPDDCKDIDAVVAYRKYYNQHKQDLASWKNRPTPAWVTH